MPAQLRDENGRILVDSLAEVPQFAEDEECGAYWETHTPSDAYLRDYRLPSDDPRVKRLRERIPPRADQQAG